MRPARSRWNCCITLTNQQPRELGALIDLMIERGVRSYLEVGAKYGETFKAVMESLPVGSYGMAVDLPGGPWGTHESKKPLIEVIRELNRQGYVVDYHLGSSHDANIDRWFDCVLIDADHRYESVKLDYEIYGNAPMVAFHDIDGEGIELKGMPIGVPKFWREVRRTRPFREFIDPSDDRPMGIGVLL